MHAYISTLLILIQVTGYQHGYHYEGQNTCICSFSYYVPTVECPDSHQVLGPDVPQQQVCVPRVSGPADGCMHAYGLLGMPQTCLSLVLVALVLN